MPGRRATRPSARSRSRRAAAAGFRRILSVDVGGSWIKAAVLLASGRVSGSMLRVATPRPATPESLLRVLTALAARLGPFTRVALAFPGPVRRGRVLGAPNLAPGAWRGCPLAALVRRRLGRPVRVANDAVVQGLGVIRSRGVELILTFGTGLGSALFVDGCPAPFELGHLPWERGQTYEGALGEAARRRVGTRRWRTRVVRALGVLRRALQPDIVYLGAGNSARLARLNSRGLRPVSNAFGVTGGAALWSGPRRAGRA